MALSDALRNLTGVAVRRATGDAPADTSAPEEPCALPEEAPEAPTPPDHTAFVAAAFELLLHRAPNAEEAEHFAAVTGHLGHDQLLRLLFASEERRHRHGVDDASEFYAGHFYSPVIDPE